jgi:arylsulfatase A-like enzyme
MKSFLLSTLCVMLVSGLFADQKYNILFIMVDDLGKEWVSAYGAEDIQTPRIDALAKGGMLFHNAYSMPQCTPSRATLLTGKYPFRNGYVNHWDVPRWGVGYFDWKQKQNTTFARLMKGLGYTTVAAGKWQINDFRIEPRAMEKHGFDDWCMWTGYETGVKASAMRYQDAYINTPEGSKTYEGQFGPDVYVDHLIRFIQRNKDKPMCLYYPMALTHTPLVATPDEPSVSDNLGKHKAMVRYMDKMVGRLVDALDELELREKTIILFTTDNGSTNGILGHRKGEEVKGAKARKIEAGVCEPFIANCPGTVPAGVETDALTDFSDLLPTFVELGGGSVPDDLVIDGKSFAPLLLGKAKDSPRDWILAMGHGPGKLDELGVRGKVDFAERVLRDKRYKVWVNESRTIYKLFDLQSDPWEKTNLLGVEQELPEHVEAVRRFQKIVDAMPETDARPLYEPRAANPWDKKIGSRL